MQLIVRGVPRTRPQNRDFLGFSMFIRILALTQVYGKPRYQASSQFTNKPSPLVVIGPGASTSSSTKVLASNFFLRRGSPPKPIEVLPPSRAALALTQVYAQMASNFLQNSRISLSMVVIRIPSTSFSTKVLAAISSFAKGQPTRTDRGSAPLACSPGSLTQVCAHQPSRSHRTCQGSGRPPAPKGF